MAGNVNTLDFDLQSDRICSLHHLRHLVACVIFLPLKFVQVTVSPLHIVQNVVNT